MKSNKFTVLAIILLFTSWVASAQEQTLTLQDAIALSLKNNKQIKLNGARIDEAVARLKGARENRLPEVSISGAYMRLNQPTVDLKLNTGASAPDTASRGGGGIQVSEAMYGIANVSLPLFAGFKIQAGIESAKYLAQAAKLDAEQNKEEVIQNTIAAYSNLYKASQAVALVKENLKSAQQRVNDFQNLEKNGLLARNDLLKAQLQASNIELSLLDAESNVKIATVNMNLMLGLPEETLIVTDKSSLNQMPTDIRSLPEWEALALQHHNDIAALAAREKAAKAGIKFANSDYFPSLALTGGYIAAYVPNVITITNALNGGIGFKYTPSSLWKNGSKVAEAKSRLHQVHINQMMLDDQIRMNINQNYQYYMVSLRKIDVYEKAVAQAEENYRITRNKHDNSLATTTDLLDADVAQLQARLNYTYSIADAAVAYNKLLQTAGMITTAGKQ